MNSMDKEERFWINLLSALYGALVVVGTAWIGSL